MKKLKSSILTAIIGVFLAVAPMAATLTYAAGDTSAPSAPTGLTAVLNVGGQVFLSWSPATDNVGVTGYSILRNNSIMANTGGTSYIDTTVTPDTTYSYTVMAYDAAGNISPVSAIVVIKTNTAGDTQIPTAPSNLTAMANSATQVTLNWDPATDDTGVTGYIIMRNNAALAYTGNTNYVDNNAQANTVYTYIILAFDAAGNISDSSSAVSITTPSAPSDTTAPTAPVNLTAIAASSSKINLSWTAATDNVGVTGYNIFRDNVKIATSSSLTFADTGLNASTTYTYSITAFDAAGNVSVASNNAAATTLAPAPSGDTTAPSAPSNLTATASSSNQVNLNWTSATDNVGVTGYVITRLSAPFALNAVPFSGFLAIASSNTFTDNTVNAHTTYYYRTFAFDAAGNISAVSNTAVVSTPSATTTPKNHEWEHQNGDDDHEDQNDDNDGNHYGQRKAELRAESTIEGQAKFSLPFGQIIRAKVHVGK